MEPEDTEQCNEKRSEDFEQQQQINMYTNSMPEVSRGDSQFFFKEIYRAENNGINYIHLGFRVAAIGPSIHDTINMVINEIHCISEDNIKLILEDEELWVTSNIAYPEHLLGCVSYNIMEAHYKQSLLKAQRILFELVQKCKKSSQNMQSQEELLKSIRDYAEQLRMAFKDPNQP